ncbi:single-stranded DNA-binding protein [Nocardioides sp. Bht2]|uniref:single-stranded DNA-binding protein n=1 Tax=Nocardioides sp. Bht2 TaxID=3392297 RepID=UPI0039B48D2B
MNENYINISGFIGTDVETRVLGDGVTVATFRVASTPRRWSNRDRTWMDAETNWYTVNAWRQLGRNCAESLQKGDAVALYGKLTTQVWTAADGASRPVMVVDAAVIGHDLNRGRSSFERTVVEGIDERALAEINSGYGVGGGQVSSDGETIEELVGETSLATTG